MWRMMGNSMLPHQISWRVDSVETLQACHQRFREEGVPVQQEAATWTPIADSTQGSTGA
jgi:hypothetical protein